MLTSLTLDVRHFIPAPVTFKPLARFTRDGSDELERQLDRICKEVLAGVRRIFPADELVGLALGGGYGRGEGGVLKLASGDQPYNDLEFYIFACGPSWWNEHRYSGALHHLAEELSRTVGIEVEFKITSLARLRRSTPSMFFYDLVLGHCWLMGDDSLFDGCEHHRHARQIPVSEATRLLMNRCSGLLFARERLEHESFTAADADFVCRNIAKAKLALGDAVLTVHRQYHWSCVERHQRLREFFAKENQPWSDRVLKNHAGGVEFKLHPHRSSDSRDELAREHRQLCELAAEVWLWVENRRLGQSFRSIGEYALASINKFPDTSPRRNLLTNLKVFGPAAIASRHRLRHPREKIINALALLLWNDDQTVCPASSKRTTEFVQLLSISGYRAAWRKVS
jgi:hypothetical protein